MLLEMSKPALKKAEAPFMPLSFSLWRQQTLTKVKRYIQANTSPEGFSLLPIDKIMHYFSKRVD